MAHKKRCGLTPNQQAAVTELLVLLPPVVADIREKQVVKVEA